MATLTGQKIKDTYDGLLKTTDSTTGLPATGKSVIQDGLGNDSALKLGQTGNGVEVDSDFDVTGNLGVNGESNFDGVAKFDADVTCNADVDCKQNVEVTDSVTVGQDLETGNDVICGNDISVVGTASIQGNALIATAGTSKVGIRTSTPAAALDVNGTIKAANININSKHIYTKEIAGAIKAVQMTGYNSGDFIGGALGPNTLTVPVTTTAFSGAGNITQDCIYKYYRITPSFWPTNQSDPAVQYFDYTLLPNSDDNLFIVIDEIMWVDNKQIGPSDPPVQRGGYVGPDADDYISIASQATTEDSKRQLCRIPLGTYRNENGKWSYTLRSSEFVDETSNFRTRVQRAGAKIILRVARLNVYDSGGNYVGPTLPNYNSLLRIKYRTFQANELFAQNQSTTLNSHV